MLTPSCFANSVTVNLVRMLQRASGAWTLRERTIAQFLESTPRLFNQVFLSPIVYRWTLWFSRLCATAFVMLLAQHTIAKRS